MGATKGTVDNGDHNIAILLWKILLLLLHLSFSLTLKPLHSLNLQA